MSVYVNLPNGEHAQRVVMAGAETGQGDVPVSSNGILPVEIQSRLASTIQSHSGVVVGASGNSSSTWIDCDGFDKIGITIKNDAAVAGTVDVRFSNDGTNEHGAQYSQMTGTGALKAQVFDVVARYVKIQYNNTDAAPHTLNIWAYLKV